MTCSYLLAHLMQEYAATKQPGLLSPGDGLKVRPSSPKWF